MPPFLVAQDLYLKSLKNSISESDLDTIIAWPENELSLLFSCADLVRRAFFKNTVDPCALMNIKSGNCSENCAFCAQSSHNNTQVAVKNLASEEEIIKNCKAAYEKGLTFCVVASGKKLSHDETQKVSNALKKCKGELHASLGILSAQEFRLLKDAGVVCYNHNLETSRRFYSHIVTTHVYDDRIRTVMEAKKAGLSVCCGGIFGMGETWEDRKSLCLELKALNVDTIPLNFLNAVPGTRVKPPVESPLEFLKIVSLFRLAHPNKTIKVCGGREVNLGKMQPLIFYAGANGYIAGDYLTTKGDSVESDDEMIGMLGLVKKHETFTTGKGIADADHD
jgi:biotin synthase